MFEKMTIKETKIFLSQQTKLSSKEEQALLNDSRKGVQEAYRHWLKEQAKKEALKERYEQMEVYEQRAYALGKTVIAGIDEVGRGPLAGPVVAAAVILPRNFKLIEINDSKQLSATKRTELYRLIQENAVSIGIGIISEEKIDQVNIYEATKLAMTQAVSKLAFVPEHLLIDAMALDLPISQEKIIKGDEKSVSIAAASIIAKVVRDRLMTIYAGKYPGYHFEKNKGYGTAEHLAGLKRYGVCPIHRRSFSPVKNYLK